MAIMTQVIEILTSGIVEVAEQLGAGIGAIVEGVFLTNVGDTTSLSTFGTLVLIFAGISLALSLFRWGLNFITSLGSSNS